MAIRQLAGPAGSGEPLQGDDPYRPIPPQSNALELIELFRRHWLLFASVLLVVWSSAIAVILHLPKMYEADAIVLIDPRTRDVLQVQPVIGRLEASAQMLETQMESELQLLLSRRVSDPVIERFHLNSDPEFNHPRASIRARFTKMLRDGIMPYLQPSPGFRGYLFRIMKDTFGLNLWSADPPPDATPVPIDREAIRRVVVDNVSRQLSARVRGRSTAIEISFESTNAVKAANIANAIAANYVQLSVQERDRATREALVTLTQRSGQLRDEVAAAENAVQEYRTKAHLIDVTGGNLISQEVAEQGNLLVRAEADLSATEARLARTERVAAHPEVTPEVLASPTVERLREEQVSAAATLAQAREQYGPQHPLVKRLVAAKAKIDGDILREIHKFVESQRAEVSGAQARVALLQQKLDALTRASYANGRAGVHLRELEREASVKRSLYEAFLRRIQEVSQQVGMAQPYAEIITPAEVPDRPAWPNSKLLIPSAFVVATAIASFCVICANMLGRSFRSLQQVEQIFGDRPIELVPQLRPSRLHLFARHELAEAPSGPYTEAIHGLRVQLRRVGENDRTILFTSAVETEGKTTTAIAFARQEARAGLRVLMIDADLRRPRLHKIFGGKQAGLVELLTGKMSLEHILQRDPVTGMLYIAAGENCVSPVDLFAGGAIQHYLRALEGHFDRIVVDSPAVLAVADARILAPLMHRTVYVVRWAQTPRRLALLAMDMLIQSGGSVVGPIFVQVDSSAVAHGGATFVRGYLT